MKFLLIISISALKAAALMSRKAHQSKTPEHREASVPKAQSAESLSHEEVEPMEPTDQLSTEQLSPVPTEVLPDNVVDFREARMRILMKRAVQLGVQP